MGLNIGEIIPKKEINFSDLKGKILAVDASNIIYQFLSTIRQPDGTPLQDKKGKITSHLSGLFYRNINLMNEGIRLVYVFDGKPPELKFKTKEKRMETKEKAREKYEMARTGGDIEGMRRFAQQLAVITPEIVAESKELLKAMGIQVVQAPSEAEAQAAYMVKKKKVFAIASQDYDSLLFEADRLIQNLTLARKRKTVSGYISIFPVIIELREVLKELKINQEQLICLGILAGTDYNVGGIRGIGQKKALDIVRKFKTPEKIFQSVEEEIKKLDEDKQFDWKEIFNLFKKHEVKEVEIKFPKLNEKKLRDILISRDFSEERIENALKKLEKSEEEKKQTGLDMFK